MTLAELLQLRNMEQPFDFTQFLKVKCIAYNGTVGKLQGYDCNICKNKGYTAVIKNGEEFLKECDCLKIRRTMNHIKNSGLQSLYDKCTFESYTAKNSWQKAIKKSAVEYAERPTGWFYIGGQSGAGKTHICASILHVLLEHGYECRYLMWRDVIQGLKANFAGYEETIKKYKESEVLYIDDLFKCGDMPTAADINIAFEIVNHRSINDLVTVISSEYTINSLVKIDTATAGRIFEHSKAHCFNLNKDEDKNMRFKEAGE